MPVGQLHHCRSRRDAENRGSVHWRGQRNTLEWLPDDYLIENRSVACACRNTRFGVDRNRPATR